MPPTWGSRSRRRGGDGGEREAKRWKSRLQRGCYPFFFLLFFFFWRVVIAVVTLVIVDRIGSGSPHGLHPDDDDDDDDD